MVLLMRAPAFTQRSGGFAGYTVRRIVVTVVVAVIIAAMSPMLTLVALTVNPPHYSAIPECTLTGDPFQPISCPPLTGTTLPN
ncbi:MAG: hypothetical protein ABI559_10585 [Chloroflexota bacterium]